MLRFTQHDNLQSLTSKQKTDLTIRIRGIRRPYIQISKSARIQRTFT